MLTEPIVHRAELTERAAADLILREYAAADGLPAPAEHAAFIARLFLARCRRAGVRPTAAPLHALLHGHLDYFAPRAVPAPEAEAGAGVVPAGCTFEWSPAPSSPEIEILHVTLPGRHRPHAAASVGPVTGTYAHGGEPEVIGWGYSYYGADPACCRGVAYEPHPLPTPARAKAEAEARVRAGLCRM